MTLYISDLDGTLLDRQARLSRRTLEILNQLLDQGMAFTIATGRTLLSAVPLLQPLNLKLPLILANGALLYDLKRHHSTCLAAFPPLSARALERAEKETGIRGLLLSQQGDRIYCRESGNKRFLWDGYFQIQNLLACGALDDSFAGRHTPGSLAPGRIFYALYMDDQAQDLARMADLLSWDPGLVCDFYKDQYSKRRWCLEITPKGGDKGKAALCLKQNCNEDRIIAFGDGLNDLPLFAVSDLACAPANACHEVRERAHLIIGSNYEDGVATYLLETFAKI
ncbi:MAG TPA: HAD family phosphatase [Clostridiaceae bacterium]|nr:HAD family phosphatase [Clostridiaceae bacterium]